ncbi:para-nitrobenzyl esterase [Penicillium chermesinum]|nr:para-nitrobenzyl esterase [Penicillium chermesinum]
MLFSLLSVAVAAWAVETTATPVVVDPQREITYKGLDRNDIEVFLNIPYGLDTGGTNRFKPPRPYVAKPGSTIHAQSYGPACPQQLGEWTLPISLGNITNISEDCLNLNVARPKGTTSYDKLPVMAYLHGGSFWTGSNEEITIRPDGLILESVQNALPVLHVAMNYRLGFFGFAQSDALKEEGSENAGLRDQRLALEWIQENIGYFGGDPKKVTIFGQSSGGMFEFSIDNSASVIDAKGICESQALEPGITGEFTINAMQRVVDYVGCNTSSVHSKETVKCLRDFDMQKVLNASLETYTDNVNIGDIWLPAVDGDFLPAAPSDLIKEHRFANVTTMIGWCQDDVSFFTDTTIKTPEDTYKFISSYVDHVSEENIKQLLSLYPVSDFSPNEKAGLSSEFYRSARIFRDIIMTCQPTWYAEHIAAAGNTVYLYDWNQTILEPVLAVVKNQTGYGVIHTSEFAYIFGNLSHYDTNGYPFHPTREDYALRDRGSRSWSTFASTGKPGLHGRDTFQGFDIAFPGDNETHVFVIGGPHEGLSAFDGDKAHPVIKDQKLNERCAFLNSPRDD